MSNSLMTLTRPAITPAHDREWAQGTRLLAPPTRPRCRIYDPEQGAYTRDGEIPDHVPYVPMAVYLADGERYYTLGFDFDASRGSNPDAATIDAKRFTDDFLRPAGVTAIAVPSGGGGWHVWVPLGRGIGAARVREMARVVGGIFPTLDITPLSNPKTGCLRPPGTPHKDGESWSGWVDPDAIEAAMNYNAGGIPGNPNGWARLCSAFNVDDGYRIGGTKPSRLYAALTGRLDVSDRSQLVSIAVTSARYLGWSLERLREVVAQHPGAVQDRVREEWERNNRDYLAYLWNMPARRADDHRRHNVADAVLAWYSWAENVVPDTGKLWDALHVVWEHATRDGWVEHRNDGWVFLTLTHRDAGSGMSCTGNTARKYIDELCNLGVMKFVGYERGSRFALPIPNTCEENEQGLTGGDSLCNKTLLKSFTNNSTPIPAALSGRSNPTVARHGDAWRRVLRVLRTAPATGWTAGEIATRANVSVDSTRRYLAEWARADGRYPFALRVARGLYAPAENLDELLREAPHVDGAHLRNSRRRVKYTCDAYAWHVAAPISDNTGQEPAIIVGWYLPPWVTQSRRVGTVTLQRISTSSASLQYTYTGSCLTMQRPSPYGGLRLPSDDPCLGGSAA